MGATARLIMMFFAGAAIVTMFFAYRHMMNQMVQGRRDDFTEAEIAAGTHCQERFHDHGSALRTALEDRMGNNLDDRVVLTLREVELGPLQTDGTRRLVALYYINRLGEKVGPVKKATGTLVNDDCAVSISVFQN